VVGGGSPKRANSAGKAATHRASSGPTRSNGSRKRTHTPSADTRGGRLWSAS